MFISEPDDGEDAPVLTTIAVVHRDDGFHVELRGRKYGQTFPEMYAALLWANILTGLPSIEHAEIKVVDRRGMV